MIIVFFLCLLLQICFICRSREVCHQVNIREKLGFDYFLVGRDHAGANNYYKLNNATDIIKELKIHNQYYLSLWKLLWITRRKIVIKL